MLRKSFRIGLRLGLLVGIGIAVAKLVQSRQEQSAAPAPQTTWPPLEPREPARSAAPTSAPAAKAPAGAKNGAKKASKSAAAKKTKKKAAAKATAWVESNDGVCPTSHPVKGKLSSKIFHLPGMLNYDRTNADRCYVDADAATGDGLRAAKR